MHSRKLLVVDDDPVVRELLKKQLSKAGHTVDTRDNGKDALDFIKKTPPDIVITDLKMPGRIDGISLLQSAKKTSSAVEVILITAHASTDSALAAMKQGAVDYLYKPVNIDKLLLLIEKIEENREQREAYERVEQDKSKAINDLTLMVREYQQKLAKIEKQLSKKSGAPETRINAALKIIKS